MALRVSGDLLFLLSLGLIFVLTCSKQGSEADRELTRVNFGGPPGNANQLTNLKPLFRPGNTALRRSRDVHRAIR